MPDDAEVWGVVVGVVVVLIGGVEAYALKTRRIPTLTEVARALPWPVRVAIGVAGTAGLLHLTTHFL